MPQSLSSVLVHLVFNTKIANHLSRLRSKRNFIRIWRRSFVNTIRHHSSSAERLITFTHCSFLLCCPST